MDLASTKTAAKDIKGWLTERESELLYRLAMQMKGNGNIVEIGSWQGKSTVFIASGLLESVSNKPFFAVDPHTGSEEHQSDGTKVWTYDSFVTNIKNAGVDTRVTPIVKDSVSFADSRNEPVEFAFIDGAHDVVSVQADFDAWFPKVIEGGYMAFHDTYAGGDPYKVMKKKLYTSRRFGLIRRTDSITYAKKIKKNNEILYIVNVLYMGIIDAAAIFRKVFKIICKLCVKK